jgi:hypothetical protein
MHRTVTLHAANGKRYFALSLAQARGECDGCAAQHNAMLCEALPVCGDDTSWTEIQSLSVNALGDAVES